MNIMREQNGSASAGRVPVNLTLNLLPRLQARLLSNLYKNLFDVVQANTPALAAEAYRLRYRVFCLENDGFEDAASHPSGMESDAYDAHTEQVMLVYKPTKTALGTLRIIKPNSQNLRHSFPMQEICDATYLNDKQKIINTCEVSRLSISKELRKQVRQHILVHGHEFMPRPFYKETLIDAIMAIAPFGLYQGAFDMALDRGLSKMLGTMELFHMERLQKKAGLVVHKLGDEIEHHGIRQPFVMNILETCENMQKKTPLSWSIISDTGRLHRKAKCLNDIENMRYLDTKQQKGQVYV